FIEEMEPEFMGPNEATSLDTVEEEHDNIRAALQWIWDQEQVIKGLRLAASIARFWYRRGYLAEGETWLKRFLEVTGTPSAPPKDVLVMALDGAGLLLLQMGKLSEARTMLERARGLYLDLQPDHTRGLALTYLHLGSVAFRDTDLDVAANYYRLSLG